MELFEYSTSHWATTWITIHNPSNYELTKDNFQTCEIYFIHVKYTIITCSAKTPFAQIDELGRHWGTVYDIHIYTIQKNQNHVRLALCIKFLYKHLNCCNKWQKTTKRMKLTTERWDVCRNACEKQQIQKQHSHLKQQCQCTT